MKGHKPKKSLGQNFLQDEKALEKIIGAADLSVDDNVLEIGPGTGALSEKLVECAGRVLMIEKDEELARQLASDLRFKIIVIGDILKINLPKLIEANDFDDYKVVANIPYYITGKIVRLLFETQYVPKLIVLLVQKEVAERICAKPGAMSILSVTAQHFGKCEIVDFVSKESFFPVPKVDSAIIKISPFKDSNALKEQSKQIFKIVKIGFAARRKTLLNNLVCGLNISKQVAEEILKKSLLEENIRAQNLSVSDWKVLVDQIQIHRQEGRK